MGDKRSDMNRRQFLHKLGLGAADYMARKEQFAAGLRKALPDASSWATQCTDCETCLAKCPQQIRIPNQMARIVETLRKR